MKTKKRPSVNIEYADSFRDPKSPKYRYGSPNNDLAGITKQVEKAMKLDETLPPSKQAQVNRIGSALNRMAKRGTTPTPSPRGEAPKPRDKAKPQKAVTPFPRTHTSNKTTKKLVDSVEKYAKGTQPQSFDKRRSDPIADKINSDRLEELREKARKRNGGKQSRLPKYDKKTGKKI